MRFQTSNYLLICLVSMLLLLMALVERGLWPFALLPVLVGVLAVLMKWRMGNGLFLVSLGGILFAVAVRPRLGGMLAAMPPFHPSDVLICGSALTYVIGHTRLMSLTRNILPRDLRREEWLRMSVAQRGHTELFRNPRLERLPEGVTSGRELVRLLVSVPVWVVLGQLAWVWLGRRSTQLLIHPDLWRLVLVFLANTLGVLTVHTLFTFWRFGTMSKVEARMILQDTQWLDMRKEQRLVSRWLGWARWRNARKDKA
jgi:hypothetical protein